MNNKILEKIRNIYKEGENENFLKEKDFWVSLALDRPISIPIVRLMQRLNLKIHPNIVSLTSLPFVILAAYFFFNGKLLFGAICYFCYFILDGVDGKWARLTGKASKFGARLEYYICILGNLAMYFGLWYSQYYLRGDWLIGGSFIFAHYVIIASLWIFLQKPYYETFFQSVRSYYSFEEEGVGTFFFAPLFNVVDVLFPTLVILQFISFTILFFRQKERPNVKKRIKEKLIRI